MKKTFSLSHDKKAPARMADAAKFEIKKYFKRERNKKLPEGFDCWDFDCRFGSEVSMAKVIAIPEIGKLIDSVVDRNELTFYLEILAKPCKKEARVSVISENIDTE